MPEVSGCRGAAGVESRAGPVQSAGVVVVLACKIANVGYARGHRAAHGVVARSQEVVSIRETLKPFSFAFSIVRGRDEQVP